MQHARVKPGRFSHRAAAWRTGLLAVLTAYTLAGSAAACVLGPGPRHNLTLFAAPAPVLGRPQEVVVFPQSLLSLLVDKSSSVTVFNGRDAQDRAADDSAYLEEISDQRYLELLSSRQQSVPPEQRNWQPMLDQPRSTLQFRRFGALGLGTSYVVVRNKAGAQWALRVAVVAPPVDPLPVQRIDEHQAGEPVYVQPEAALWLELPGQVADGWRVAHSDGALGLARLEPLADGRVRIVLDRQHALPSESELQVQAGSGKSYRFRIRPRPVPAC